MTGWSFVALGRPAPQGSKKHVGHGIMVEASVHVEPWREAIKAAAPSGPTLDGPVAVFCAFTLPRPSSARKKDTTPFRAPDLDKLVRSTFDGLTQAGLLVDDARVAQLTAMKVWKGYHPYALETSGVLLAGVEMAGDWDMDDSDLDFRLDEALMKHRQEWR